MIQIEKASIHFTGDLIVIHANINDQNYDTLIQLGRSVPDLYRYNIYTNRYLIDSKTIVLLYNFNINGL